MLKTLFKQSNTKQQQRKGRPSLRMPASKRGHILFTVFAFGLVASAGGVSLYLDSAARAYDTSAFAIRVKTDNPGTSNATSFTIPTTGTGYSYNVDCNDDGVNEVTARTTSYTCVYPQAGTYTIAITGTFPRIFFNNGGDRQKLLDVEQWGTGAWTSMDRAFYGAINMQVSATDAPNLTNVTNMASMFRDATSFNSNINHWDVSNVTNMSCMFCGATLFNQPLNGWDTSSVASMSFMFDSATAFNRPLDNWDTSGVTDMTSMFRRAVSFNQPIGNWNTSNVTSMSGMFGSGCGGPCTSANHPGAISFNQPLNDWDTSSVTNMAQMFQSAISFNQPLDNWDTSSVTAMWAMFKDATSFDRSLSNWNISNVANMQEMFEYATLSVDFYDGILSSWSQQSVQPNVTFHGGNSTYSLAGAEGRSTLTSAPNNWTIIDDGWPKPTVTSPSASQIIGTNKPVFSGTTVGSGEVIIKLNNQTYTVQADAEGAFSLTWPESLPNGWYIAEVAASDGMGTTSPAEYRMFQIFTGQTISVSGNSLQPTLTLNSSPLPQPPLTGTWDDKTDTTNGFPARGSHGFVSFNDKLWVVGGQDALSRFNDTWSSHDGISWTQEVESAPWTQRAGHQVVVFDGKMWVIGGQNGGANKYNDVWSSSDGVNWTEETSSAAWSGRVSHEVVVHDGAMWLMGGQDASGVKNDVWRSTDGVTWTEVTASAGWPKRNGFTTTSFGGKLWMFGGVVAGSESNDIWSSPDGITWTQETAAAEWQPRASHKVEVLSGKMYLMGGSGENWDTEYGDIWVSDDGVSWSLLNANPGWEKRRGFSSAAHDGKVFISGGRVGQDWTLASDVWSSAPEQAISYWFCWGTSPGSCEYSAESTEPTYTITQTLSPGTWFFSSSTLVNGVQVSGLAAEADEPLLVTQSTAGSYDDVVTSEDSGSGLANTGIAQTTILGVSLAVLSIGIILAIGASRLVTYKS